MPSQIHAGACRRRNFRQRVYKFVVRIAAEKAIVPAGARLELLYTRSLPIQGGLTEGPAAAPDGSIYFTDIPEGTDRG